MKTLVVYESMYGNTRRIAEAVADGIRRRNDVKVVQVADAVPELVTWADSIVVGGPTHAHGLSRTGTRSTAGDALHKASNADELRLEPGYGGIGVREWLAGLADGHGKGAAAFDTRIKAPALLTGRASLGIARELRRHGYDLLTEPESFIVTTHNELIDGELTRAWEWGAELVGGLVPVG